MQLDYRMPSAAFGDALSVIGHVHALSGAIADTVPALLPNLHLRIAGRSRYSFRGGPMRDAPPATLIGATSAAFAIEMSADFEMICIGILPEGWRRAVGHPGELMVDDMIDAALVWPAGAVAALVDAVAAVPDFARRHAAVEGFLAARASERLRADPRRIAAVRQWLETPGALSLDALAQRIDLSPRQIARLTLDCYGASPKTLAMKYRALRAAGTLAVHGAAGYERALAGYADQSHLIRDFHRFIGWTPRHFLGERQPIARATMARRWAAGARSTMALCS